MMDKEVLVKFKALAEEDTELMAKLKAAKSTEEIVSIAAEKGFTIDPADLAPSADGVLNLDEMDAIAGGSVEECYDTGSQACGYFFGVSEW